MLKPFEIHEPATNKDAVNLLAQHGEDATPYAGGTELLTVMREGFARYSHLVNVKAVDGINRIELSEDQQWLRIAAGVTHREIETSELVAQYAPLLVEVERKVANIRVRETGTIGGNLCFADPNSDPATLFMAWENAQIELQSPRGVRQLAPQEFFLESYVTARQNDEIMTALLLPVHKEGQGYAFEKFVQLERPTANVAAFLSMADGEIDFVHIALGSVTPVPVRLTEAEALLSGKQVSNELIAKVGETASQSIEPTADHYGSIAYKRNLVSVLVERALHQAVARLG